MEARESGLGKAAGAGGGAVTQQRERGRRTFLTPCDTEYRWWWDQNTPKGRRDSKKIMRRRTRRKWRQEVKP